MDPAMDVLPTHGYKCYVYAQAWEPIGFAVVTHDGLLPETYEAVLLAPYDIRVMNATSSHMEPIVLSLSDAPDALTCPITSVLHFVDYGCRPRAAVVQETRTYVQEGVWALAFSGVVQMSINFDQ